MTFEKNLNELEKKVQQLEEGELTLQQTIKTFEEGLALKEACKKELDEASQRVETLTKEGEPDTGESQDNAAQDE